MPVSYCARTHPGLRRAANEDCFVARPDLGLFAVADGLGGHAAGHVASRLAIEAVEGAFAGTLAPEERARYGVEGAAGDRVATLVQGFRVGNGRIGLNAGAEAALAGMGTTLAVVLLEPVARAGDVAAAAAADGPQPAGAASGSAPARAPNGAIIAHVGDSRVYHWSEGRLRRLTDDHSWVEEQVRRGGLTPDEARHHPWRSLITRALNGDDDVEVDVDHVALRPGDRLLVCSDGLSSVVPDEEIAALLAREPADDAACGELIEAANQAGGPDNITVIVITP